MDKPNGKDEKKIYWNGWKVSRLVLRGMPDHIKMEILNMITREVPNSNHNTDFVIPKEDYEIVNKPVEIGQNNERNN